MRRVFYLWGDDLKILIVCYDSQLAALTAKSLERKGYTVICCCDVSETEDIINKENIRLVIADIDADENERLQFCKTVRKMGEIPKLLFIGRSGEEESRALNTGADDWIKKPYKSAVFQARISALLRQSEYTSISKKEEDLLT